MEQLSHILFIDIETVPVVADMSVMKTSMQEHWTYKSSFIKKPAAENADPAALFTEKAGIYAEFGKVVCIGMGCLVKKEPGWQILLKSIAETEEKILLKNFSDALGRFAERFPELRFCGHNIKEFDIPYLCRRMIINGLPLPAILQLSGKKPWENPHLDTLELWRFGDYKHYTSLSLLADVLDIPSPKEDLDGSMVANVFWQQQDLDRIAKYCLQDVLTSCRVFLKLKGYADDVQPLPVYVNDMQ